MEGGGEGGAVGAQAVQLGCLAACLIPQVLQLRIIVSQLAQQLGHPPFQLLRLDPPHSLSDQCCAFAKEIASIKQGQNRHEGQAGSHRVACMCAPGDSVCATVKGGNLHTQHPQMGLFPNQTQQNLGTYRLIIF